MKDFKINIKKAKFTKKAFVEVHFSTVNVITSLGRLFDIGLSVTGDSYRLVVKMRNYLQIKYTHILDKLDLIC